MDMTKLNMQTARRADLAARAMLVSLSVGQWTARKLDKKISADVAKQHGAKGSAGNYNKVLIARGNLAAIASVVAAARETHATLTLPWMQDGTRIMPVDAFKRYSAEMQRHREAFEREVNEFCDAYPDYIAQARDSLGDMYNAGDYPSVTEIRKRFHWSVSVLPLPDAADFRVDLDADTVKRMQEELASDVADAFNEAIGDTFERLHKVTRAMADKLTAYDPTKGKQGNPFRDSLVQNVRELVDVLPMLNVTGDARLSKAIEEVQAKLTKHDAQDLREDDVLRAETAKAAADIADAMAGYM